jgi:hypothetical protein
MMSLQKKNVRPGKGPRDAANSTRRVCLSLPTLNRRCRPRGGAGNIHVHGDAGASTCTVHVFDLKPALSPPPFPQPPAPSLQARHHLHLMVLLPLSPSPSCFRPPSFVQIACFDNCRPGLRVSSHRLELGLEQTWLLSLSCLHWLRILVAREKITFCFLTDDAAVAVHGLGLLHRRRTYWPHVGHIVI